ncbi:MAG: acyltransferase family protein [Candidatus Gastranaerophilaceae bacterium]
MEKIKNIEVLRIIGCIAVVMFHLSRYLHKLPDVYLYDKLYGMLSNGQKAVDLFFILSGFFFAYTLKLDFTCWEFIKRKLIRLYPVMIFTYLTSFLISLTGVFKFGGYDDFLALLCLNGIGLALKLGTCGHFWYISAMLWTLLLFYFLRKNYNKRDVNLFIILLVFFSYSFIIHAKNGMINAHTQTFDNFINIGLLRGFGGIGVGYLIGEWYKANREILKYKVTELQKLFYTGLEFVCLFFIVNNLLLHNLHYKNHIIFILVFAFTSILFILKKGCISKILDKNIFVSLSKYTFSIYMTHLIVIRTLAGTLWKQSDGLAYIYPVFNVVLTLLLILFFGVFTYHFVEKSTAKYLKDVIK